MLINYLGHQFLASLNLPLGERVAGQSGTDEKYEPVSDVGVLKFLNELLEQMGLKVHGGTHRYSTKQGVKFAVDPPEHHSALPFDAEVFKSKFHHNDGLYFIVDTARMMPPGFRKKEGQEHNPYLYQHMRKEFVKWYYVDHLERKGGLSCDAFSSFSRTVDNEPLEYNEEVSVAYQFYLDHVPKKVAEHLSKRECEAFSDDLVRMVHYFGLNLRDLGRVYQILDSMENKKIDENGMKWEYSAAWKRRILVEIIARSFRRVADRNLFLLSTKPNTSVKDSEIKELITALFNAVLWESPNNRENRIWDCMNRWKDECFPTLRTWDDKPVLLNRSQLFVHGSEYLLENFLWISSNLLGVKWTFAVWNNRQNVKFFQKEDVKPVDVQHVKEVQPRVLELNMAHHARGVALSEVNPEDREANLEQIVNSFQNALDRQPSNGHTMDRLARAYKDYAKYLEKRNNPGDRKQIEILRKRSEYLVEMCSKVPDAHEDSLFAYALQLMEKNCKNCVNGGEPDPQELNNLRRAEGLFETAISKNHKHSKAMIADLRYFCLHRPIGDVLEYLRDVDGKNGSNVGYHSFVYLLANKEWDKAAIIAHNLRISSITSRKRDQGDEKRLKAISEFQSLLEKYLSRQ